MYYKRCYAIGYDACKSILEENDIDPMANPRVILAEAIEFGDIDEIELIIAESGN